MSDDDTALAARVRRECKAQGLPVKVQDLPTIRRVVELLTMPDNSDRASTAERDIAA